MNLHEFDSALRNPEEEGPVQISIKGEAVEAIQRIAQRCQFYDYYDLGFKIIDLLKFITDEHSQNKFIMAGKPGKMIPDFLSSPILEAGRNEAAPEDPKYRKWVDRYLENVSKGFYGTPVELEFNFPHEQARILSDLEIKTGTSSFQALFVHGIMVFDEISRRAQEGEIFFTSNLDDRREPLVRYPFSLGGEDTLNDHALRIEKFVGSINSPFIDPYYPNKL